MRLHTHLMCSTCVQSRVHDRPDISPARVNPSGHVLYYLRSGSRSDLNYSIYDCCPVSRASVWLAALMRRTRPEPLKSSLFCWLGILIIRRPGQIAFTSLSHEKKKRQQKTPGEFMTQVNTIQWNEMNVSETNNPNFERGIGKDSGLRVIKDENPCFELVMVSHCTQIRPTLQPF